MTARFSGVRGGNEMAKEEKTKGCWSLVGARHHFIRVGRMSRARKKSIHGQNNIIKNAKCACKTATK